MKLQLLLREDFCAEWFAEWFSDRANKLKDSSTGPGKLLKATAYEVAPKQDSKFEGGIIDDLSTIEKGLAMSVGKDHLETGLPVNLQLDKTTRTSDMRDAIEKAAFEEDLLQVSLFLAKRLGKAMDFRSGREPSLLIVSVHEDSNEVRQVIIWIFPKGQVIRRSGKTVDLEEAFILNSRLRKAAFLKGGEEGKGDKSGFLTARVLDYQATAADRKVSDFWITKFLDARLQMSGSAGTNRLASIFQEVNDTLGNDPKQQDILHNAMAAVRVKDKQRLSIQSIAMDFLPEGPVRKEMLKATNNEEEAKAVFELDLKRFDELVHYHIYMLANGVRVSAPFKQIGEDVKIKETEDGRILSASGVIKGEKIRRSG